MDDTSAAAIEPEPRHVLTAPVAPPGAVADRCAEPAGPAVNLPTVADVAARLVRRWALCAGPSLLGNSNETGMEFAADGRWYKLFCTSGVLVRGTRFDDVGSWSLFDMSLMNGPGSWQMNMEYQGGGYGSWCAFSDDPPVMRIGYDFVAADYVPANADGSCVPVAPKPPPEQPVPSALAPEIAAACAEPQGAAVVTQSADHANERVLGRWMACNRPSLIGTVDDVGIDFSADGRWYRLFRSPSGEIVRGLGFEKSGTWKLTDATDAPGPYELRLKLVGLGAIIDFPAFSDGPSAMRLLTFGLNYVRPPQ